MRALIFSLATRFIGLLPPLVIALVTLVSNPNLHKKKQQSIINSHKAYLSKIK
jgi:hypothetical protein